MPNRTPRSGDAYRDENGNLLLFVRTEKRPGTSAWTGAGPDDHEHYFIGVHADKRTDFHKWYLADGGRPLPESLELVVNAGADHRIDELERQARELEAERAALVECMKTAVGVVPVPVANHLREVYRKHRGEALKGLGS